MCCKVPHLWVPCTYLFTDLFQSVFHQRCRWREWSQKVHPMPLLWSVRSQQSIFPLLHKGSSKNCSQFPSVFQCSEHWLHWQLGEGGRMYCLYPFLIAGDCKVDLREINTLLLSSPPLSTPAHLVYRWAFNNNFQYRNFLNCFFRFLLQTTVVGLLMGKAEQMDFMYCASARRGSERAQNHLNDKSNIFFKYFPLCNNLLLQPCCHK